MKTSPHTKPAIASITGLLIGLLTLLHGFLVTKGVPTPAQIAQVVSGSGISLGSVATFVLSHLGITKAQIVSDTRTAVAALPAQTQLDLKAIAAQVAADAKAEILAQALTPPAAPSAPAGGGGGTGNGAPPAPAA